MKKQTLSIQDIFNRIKRSAIKARKTEIENNIYSESSFESMLDDDEMTVEEAWFMQGWNSAFDKLNGV